MTTAARELIIIITKIKNPKTKTKKHQQQQQQQLNKKKDLYEIHKGLAYLLIFSQ